jgi:hypothetical protein
LAQSDVLGLEVYAGAVAAAVELAEQAVGRTNEPELSKGL